MSNLAETPTYDSGVYQIELLDPVQGGSTGLSNKPLINLANRTAYLKQHIDALELASAGWATLASPTFTGTPLAPTPPLGDNSTKIPTTAFVQNTLNGILNKNVAGNTNVNLTAVEAGNGVLNFTGVLTGNIDVIVPATNAKWIVQNNTTGAYTLRVKTAAGSGVFVKQARRAGLLNDGTNVVPAQTDYTDVALEGAPTAPTAAPGTSTIQIASTAFVTTALTALSGIAVTKDSSTGAAYIPVGTTAQRPTPDLGRFRVNSDTSRAEMGNGSAFVSLGGATGGGNDAVFYNNDNTVNNDYTIPAGQNAVSAGPIGIATGKTVTIPSGSSWAIV